MNFTPSQQAKVDPLLQEILTNADRNDYLHVIMILKEDESSTQYSNQILPTEFLSRPNKPHPLFLGLVQACLDLFH